MTLQFAVPAKPSSELCESSWLILKSAHTSASSFLALFKDSRKARSAKGNSTDDEQDLLRATIVFASAGLDALIKQLIRDSLEAVIEKSEGACEQFRSFVESRIKRDDPQMARFLAHILSDNNPRKRLIAELVRELTGASLQSAEQIFKVASYFDIPTNKLSTQPKSLKDIFAARNQIVHEMDVNFEKRNRSRRQRAKSDIIKSADEIFNVAASFLGEVDKILAHKSAEPVLPL